MSADEVSAANTEAGKLAVYTVGLTKRFPGVPGRLGLFPARGEPVGVPQVDGVSLAVRQGELFGLLGPNGAGKTTFIKMLCTLIEPTAGTAWVNGHALKTGAAVRGSVGLVTTDERSFYWRLTGQQNLDFFAVLYQLPGTVRQDRVAAVLDQVGLDGVADQPFRHYSTGMRQRLAIARALLHQPQLLFLDEPTRGLDPPAVRGLHHLIREELVNARGLTVFLTTHWLEEAEKLCDRVGVMHAGRLRGLGTLPELRGLFQETDRYLVRVHGGSLALRDQLVQAMAAEHLPGEDAYLVASSETHLMTVIDTVREGGGQVREVRQDQIPLETIFNRLTAETSGEMPAPTDFAPVLEEGRLLAPAPLSWFGAYTQELRRLPDVAGAFLRRDWIAERSYRFAFGLQLMGILLSVLMFFFLGRLLDAAAAPLLADYGGDYFAFVVIGVAFAQYFNAGLSSFANNLRQAQTTGTLEAMLITPTRLPLIIFSASLWNYAVVTVQVLIYLLFGALLTDAVGAEVNYAAVLLILLLTIFSFSGIGIIAASFIMVMKRGNPITWLVSAFSSLLGGVYYPVEVLPAWLEAVSKLLPITYALHGLRLALLTNAPLADIWLDILALAGFAAVLLPVSLFVFRYAVRRAKVEGSLAHY